ncbi:MAG: hypothetical protein EBZ50_03855 [Alphaproteobacteria bacterium]|nr:hypothetical protein [Alphaproteobacteria bacterium]
MTDPITPARLRELADAIAASRYTYIVGQLDVVAALRAAADQREADTSILENGKRIFRLQLARQQALLDEARVQLDTSAYHLADHGYLGFAKAHRALAAEIAAALNQEQLK